MKCPVNLQIPREEPNAWLNIKGSKWKGVMVQVLLKPPLIRSKLHSELVKEFVQLLLRPKESLTCIQIAKAVRAQNPNLKHP